MCSEKVKNWCSLVASALGVLCGVAAFIALFLVYKNYEAGIWGIISAVVAAVCLHMSCLAVRDRLDLWHSPDTLQSIFWLGCTNCAVGLSGLVWNVVRTTVFHVPVLPVSDSSAMSALWASVVAMWGLLVALHSRRYFRQLLSGAGGPLLPPRRGRPARL